MKNIVAIALAVTLAGFAPLRADEIKSNAESWGVQNERAAVISGKVIDIACELSGDCAADCGAGSRYLGVKTEDGKLVLVTKNGQPAFSGAVRELLPWCQKTVDLDGNFVGNDKFTVYQVQFIRAKGTQAWIKTEAWTKDWQSQNPQAKGDPLEWYYDDPRVKKEIDANGHLGLGPAADTAYIKAN